MTSAFVTEEISRQKLVSKRIQIRTRHNMEGITFTTTLVSDQWDFMESVLLLHNLIFTLGIKTFSFIYIVPRAVDSMYLTNCV